MSAAKKQKLATPTFAHGGLPASMDADLMAELKATATALCG